MSLVPEGLRFAATETLTTIPSAGNGGFICLSTVTLTFSLLLLQGPYRPGRPRQIVVKKSVTVDRKV